MKATFKKVKSQIQKGANPEKQLNVDMNKPVNTETYGIRLFLFKTELSHASANP